jgi:hypothetical protein
MKLEEASQEDFAYGVLYVIDHEQIFVLAVMNLHKAPEYWKDRLKEKS